MNSIYESFGFLIAKASSQLQENLLPVVVHGFGNKVLAFFCEIISTKTCPQRGVKIHI